LRGNANGYNCASRWREYRKYYDERIHREPLGFSTLIFLGGGKRDGHRIDGSLSENRPDILTNQPREPQPLHFLHQPSRAVLLSHNSRFSLAQKSRIESRIASRGNHTLGGCQASEDIALTRDDGLTMLRRVSLTPAHNIVRQCNASCGKFFLVLFEALEHVVCEHWYPGALLFEFFTASSRDCSVLRLSNIDMGGRN
jgi:hypothetical protein